MKITENFTHLIRDIYLLSFKDILQYYMKKKKNDLYIIFGKIDLYII